MSRNTNQTTVPIFGYLRGETPKALKVSITHCKSIKLEKNFIRWFPKSQIEDVSYEGSGNLEMVEFRAKEWMFEDEDWYKTLPAVGSPPKVSLGELTGNLTFGRNGSVPVRPYTEVNDDWDDDDIPF